MFPILVVLWASGVVAAVPLTLELGEGSGYDIDYTLSHGPTGAGRDDRSGTVEAEVSLDALGRVERFRMTGGRIAHSDGTIEVPLGGPYLLTFTTLGAVSLPHTESWAGWVNVATGALQNEGSFLIVNEGTLTTLVTQDGLPVDGESRDFAVLPDPSPLQGETRVTATETGHGGWWKRVRIDLEHERNTSRTYPVGDSPLVPPGTTYTITEVGGMTASAELVIPGGNFIAWAEAARGVTPSDLADREPLTGQPLLVLYAFRAGPGCWNVPVSFDTDAAQVTLHLPEEGLCAPVRWEFWSGNVGASWEPLAGTPEAGGVTPVGSSGPQVLPIPAGGKGFVRAAVPVPEVPE